MDILSEEWVSVLHNRFVHPEFLQHIHIPNKSTPRKSSEHRLMCWPSTPALFWSRDAPEIWGIHLHGFDAEGKRVIDDTYGSVYVDGKKLDRAKLFGDMLNNSFWMVEEAEMAACAEELEDDWQTEQGQILWFWEQASVRLLYLAYLGHHNIPQ